LADSTVQAGTCEVGGARYGPRGGVDHMEHTSVRMAARGKQGLQLQRERWGWGASGRSGRCADTQTGDSHAPALVLDVRGGLEHGLNGPLDRRDRAGLPQPWAATLREERPMGRPPSIPRENNDPLVQGRILTREDGVEGWPVQVGPM
jgi:hypothetical protein